MVMTRLSIACSNPVSYCSVGVDGNYDKTVLIRKDKLLQ